MVSSIAVMRRVSRRYGAAGSIFTLQAGHTISGPSSGAMNRSSAFGSTVMLRTATDTVRPPLEVSNTSKRHRHFGQVIRPPAVVSPSEAPPERICGEACLSSGSARFGKLMTDANSRRL